MPKQKLAKLGGMAEEQQSGEVLNYSTPALERASVPPKPPLDGYCMAAVAIALLSPLHAALAVVASGVAVFGGMRARQRQVRGVPLAIAAFVLALFWPSIAASLFNGMIHSRDDALLLACQANLRTIGQAVRLYETEYPGAKGYGLDEMMVALGSPSGAIARCPLDHEVDVNGKPVPGPSYILLPHLQPYHSVLNPAKTAIAFDLHTHTLGSGLREQANVVLLFADGHVETQKPKTAQQAIMRSLTLRPTTQPASPRPAS